MGLLHVCNNNGWLDILTVCFSHKLNLGTMILNHSLCDDVRAQIKRNNKKLLEL